MSTITILHVDSPLLDRFIETFGYAGTRYGVAHTVYSHGIQEVDPELVSISLRATTDEEGTTQPGVSFDPETYEPQELSAEEFLALVASDTTNFPPVEPEVVEPRYLRTMSSDEFMDLFTPEDELRIITASQTNAYIARWINRLAASKVVKYDEDSRIQEGVSALVSAELITQEDADRILLGKPV